MSVTQVQDDFKVWQTDSGECILVHLYQPVAERNEVEPESDNGYDFGNSWGAIPFNGEPVAVEPISQVDEYGLEARW